MWETVELCRWRPPSVARRKKEPNFRVRSSPFIAALGGGGGSCRALKGGGAPPMLGAGAAWRRRGREGERRC